ncbi:MAG: hypothetical protein E7614_03260 [Ruminococcaceae bacterium]|nr:hypothetical protein [Oscillospiraceae bacterium]
MLDMLGIGFFIIPALSVVLFIVILIYFFIVKHKMKNSLKKVTPEKIQNARIFLIISSAIAGIVVASSLLIMWVVQGIIINM